MKAKVLLLDLETSPNLGYTWSKWETNVIQFKKEWQILSNSYKWLGEKTIHCDSQRDLSERQLVKKIWKLLDEADIIVAHKGRSFDFKKIRAKFLEYGLKPPSPYKEVDTLLMARATGAFTSNALDDLGALFKIGRKAQTGGFQTWLDCMAGKPEAWARMIKYNKQDVALLERVYLKLRPYATSHPAVSRTGCPSCASTKTRKSGVLVTRTAKKQTHRCLDCGKRWTEGRAS